MRTPVSQILNTDTTRTPVSDILIQKYKQEEEVNKNPLQRSGFESLPLLDLLKGAAKGVGSGIDTINKSIADPVYKKLGLETPSESGAKLGINEETLKPTNTAQKIGYGVEQIAEFAVPETKIIAGVKALKAGKFVEPVLKALGVGASGVGVSKFQGAENTEAGIVGATSAILPPVVTNSFKMLGSTLKGVAGALSGKGTKAIDAILDNPREALKGMNQEGIDTLKQNANEIQRLGSAYYASAKTQFENTLNVIKKKVKTIDGNALNQRITDILSENNITYAPNKKGIMEVDLSGFAGDNKALLKKTFDLIKGKVNNTVEGVEEIAQTINRQKLNTNNMEIKAILGKMATAVRGSYVEQLNKMGLKAEAKIAETYAKAQDKLDTFDSLFGTDSRSKILKESTLTDIMEKVKNFTSGDKTIQADKIADIGGDIQAILAKETGRQMRENTTRSEAAIGGDTIMQMIKSVLPTKTVGSLTAKTGIVKEQIDPIIDYINKNPAYGVATKQALINYVNSFLQEE